MNMTAGTCLIMVIFCHKSNRSVILKNNLFYSIFIYSMPVSHLKCFCIVKPYFMLTCTTFSLVTFNGDLRLILIVSYFLKQRFLK